jgi:hypothetical protein
VDVIKSIHKYRISHRRALLDLFRRRVAIELMSWDGPNALACASREVLDQTRLGSTRSRDRLLITYTL